MELKSQGFKPILAHAERYTALQKDWNLAKKLHDSGVLLQVNAYDLELNMSLKTKEPAQWMAKEKLISFIGSDMHGLPPKRTPKMKEGINWLYENTDEEYADAVAFGNAEKLLMGRV
jgi:protein-tyrosine phosphatase